MRVGSPAGADDHDDGDISTLLQTRAKGTEKSTKRKKMKLEEDFAISYQSAFGGCLRFGELLDSVSVSHTAIYIGMRRGGRGTRRKGMERWYRFAYYHIHH